MESIGSVWGYQENIDELKNMLVYTTIELEAVKNDAREEMRRNEENVKQLLHLLKVACEERDEARDQLHKLLNKLMPSTSTEVSPLLPNLQPQTPPVYAINGNSSLTESDSVSKTYNHHSYCSSHVDSFLGVVSSPDLSNMNMADSNSIGMTPNAFVAEYNGSNSIGVFSSGINEPDQATIVIDNLVKGKKLPEKGKLLQTVMEAGPLLQTLLVSGPLPRWRNPPPLQPFQLPPFSVQGCHPEKINPKLLSNLNYPLQNSLTLSYTELPYGASQTCTPSTLNFTTTNTCLSKQKVLPTGVGAEFVHTSMLSGKRQRCQ